MTNPISPISQPPIPLETNAVIADTAPPKPAVTQTSGSASESDSVTLSAAAQTSTQLLGAARAASGIDQAASERIRGALASGSYNVTPKDLSQAIATLLKETS